MSQPRFGRMIPAMVTPFDENRELDLDKAQALAARLVDGGSDSLIINGTTGESPTVFYPQKIELFRAVVEAVGDRVPVIANVGDNCTADTVDFAREVAELGVDGFMCVVPYYNKPPQEGIYQHFRTIANAVELPIILYNVPSRTGVSFTAETYQVLSQNPRINGVKEASGNFSLLAHTRFLCPDDFYIWSGNDDQVVPMMSLGAKGVISVAAYIVPKSMVEMSHLCLENNFEAASKLQIEYMDLIDALFCEAQGRLHARYAAAYDCNSLHYSLMSYIVSVGQQLTTADAGLPIYFPLRPRYLAAGSYSTPILSSRGSTSTWCICIPSTHGS